MLRYDSIDEMWLDLVAELLEADGTPSRDGDVAGEILGYHGVLDASQQRTLLLNTARGLSPSYAAAETLWYLAGSADVSMLARYAPSYKKFADANGRAYGAYGPRVMPQLPLVIEQLRKSGHSRQAVVSIWSRGDLEMSGKTPDMPCTLTHQYLLRDGALHMIVSMRSNDAWLGFPYDVFAFTCLQRIVAAHLDATIGEYHHVVGSMHLYERNATKAKHALSCALDLAKSKAFAHGWRLDDTLASCSAAVDVERTLRLDGRFDVDRVAVLGDMTHDLVVACENKLGSKSFYTRSRSMRCTW